MEIGSHAGAEHEIDGNIIRISGKQFPLCNFPVNVKALYMRIYNDMYLLGFFFSPSVRKRIFHRSV